MDSIIAVHSTERGLFTRMIDMNMNLELSKKIMAFWMHLESEGFKGLLKKLSSDDDDKFLSLVCLEAETIISSLAQPNSTAPISPDSLPITLQSLANPTLSPLEVLQDRERVSKGVSDLVVRVCSMVFEDILEERGLKGSFGNGKSVEMEEGVGKLVNDADGGEGTSENGAVAVGVGGAAAGSSSSGLNPDAEEWCPTSFYHVSEAHRCLYLTFSCGHPLSSSQLWRFFGQIFGNGVKSVYVHQPMTGPPLFGKIVFTEAYMPSLILDGNEEVELLISNKTVLCKKYQPSHIRHNTLS